MAAMEKLYPPTINSSIPAFCDDGSGTVVITVPFSMNRAVSANQINSFKLKIKSAQSNSYITTLTSSNTVADAIADRSAIFTFSVTLHNAGTGIKIHIGQFLKFQLAYESTDGVTGYFSTVAVGKYTARPTVLIKQYEEHPERTLNFAREYTGEYILNPLDKSERPYAYKFTLYNQLMQVEETSDWKPHNSTLDATNLDSTIDTYTFGSGLDESQTYYIQYSIKTINDLVVSSPLYACAVIAIADSRVTDMGLEVENNFEEGYIYLYFKNTSGTTWSNTPQALSILIERADSVTNYTSWNTIKKVYFASKAAILDWSFRDMTVEQGVSYVYRFGLYDANGNQSTQSRSTIVTADFEDMFLYDGKKQIKIRFNPKVSSFKETLMESKVDTIGSKYPYIFRNRMVGYKEFPIGGLISYLADNNEMFLHKSDYEIQDPIEYKQYNIIKYVRITRTEAASMWEDHEDILFYDDAGLKKPLTAEILTDETSDYDFYKQEDDIVTYSLRSGTPEDEDNWPEKVSTTLPYGYNMRAERQFKMRLLDWLNDGHIKLFRSPAEGSFLVRLMNVSLTPEDRLGRMLHSFQAQAYEMDELNYNNLIKYGFLSNSEEESVVFTLYQDNLADKDQTISFNSSYNVYRFNSNTMWDTLTIDLSSASNRGSFGGLYFRFGTDVATKFYVAFGTTMSIEMQIDNETHVVMPDLYFFEEDNIPLVTQIGDNIVTYDDLLEGCLIRYWQREQKILSGSIQDELSRTIVAVYRANRSYNIYGLAGTSANPSYYMFDVDNTYTSGSTTYSITRLLAVQFHQRVEQSGYTYAGGQLSYNDTNIPASFYDKTVIYVTTDDKKYIVNGFDTLTEITSFGDDQIIINGDDENPLTAAPQGMSLLDYQSIDLSNAPRYYCTIIQQEKAVEFAV